MTAQPEDSPGGSAGSRVGVRRLPGAPRVGPDRGLRPPARVRRIGPSRRSPALVWRPGLGAAPPPGDPFPARLAACRCAPRVRSGRRGPSHRGRRRRDRRQPHHHQARRRPLVDAVAASCARPISAAPVNIGDRRYMDGGMRSTSTSTSPPETAR
ncbi:patatin-like phospholipase family protein [Micromonospora sp. NPDC050795]|uniref:patatin-like phospholipase family protein n=1 Tax=Micromonospora sp. NPDC050795 TaxID=3364282 RepID=UPI0037AB8205